MENKFKKYSNEVLLDMASETDDELFPFALLELAVRKNPRTPELCLEKIKWMMKFEKEVNSFNISSSSLSTLYLADKQQAIKFFKQEYKNLPLDAFGVFIDCYVDTFYSNEPLDKDLIKIIKEQLKSLSEKDLDKIREEYELFMKTFGNF